MTRRFALVFIIAAAFVGQPAECTYCPSHTCYGPCGGECVCVTPPGTSGGQCYGVERAAVLVARGWAVDSQ